AFLRQPPERAVGADVVEPVIVDAGVRDVRRHAPDRSRASQREELTLAGGVELQQRRAELESLRPLGPAARPAAALDADPRRAVRRIPAVLDRSKLRRRQLEHPIDRRQQILRAALAATGDHLVSNVMMRTRSSLPACVMPCELPVRVRIAVPGPTWVALPS